MPNWSKALALALALASASGSALASASASSLTALLFARPLALHRTGRVQSKYANVLSVKRRFDGISAHFVPAVAVAIVVASVFCCLVWLGLGFVLVVWVLLFYRLAKCGVDVVAVASSKLAVVAWSGSRQSARGCKLRRAAFFCRNWSCSPDLYAYILRVVCAIL